MIETERLVLRPIEMEDLDALVAMHADADVSRFMTYRRSCLAMWFAGAEIRGFGRGRKRRRRGW